MDPKDFFKVPEPEHHVWRLMVLVIILVVVAGLAWAYSKFYSGALKWPSAGMTPGMIKEEQLEFAANNPPVNLGAKELEIKKTQLERATDNPPINLSAQELEIKKAQLEQANR